MRYSQIFKRFEFSNGSVNFDPAVSRFDMNQAVIYLDVNTKFHSRMLIGVWDTVKFSNGSNSQTVQSISTRQSPDSTCIMRWYTLMSTPNFIPGCWSAYEIQLRTEWQNAQTVQILKWFGQFQPGSLQIRRASSGDIPWRHHQISFPDVYRLMRYSCGRKDVQTYRRTDVQTYRRKDGKRHRRTDRQTNGSDHNTWPA